MSYSCCDGDCRDCCECDYYNPYRDVALYREPDYTLVAGEHTFHDNVLTIYIDDDLSRGKNAYSLVPSDAIGLITKIRICKSNVALEDIVINDLHLHKTSDIRMTIVFDVEIEEGVIGK